MTDITNINDQMEIKFFAKNCPIDPNACIPDKEFKITFNKDEYEASKTVGRRKNVGNEISFSRDDEMSGTHVRLIKEGKDVYLLDNNSLNG